MASAYEYRDTAAATCNNDIIILDQAADGVDLDDGLRLRPYSDSLSLRLTYLKYLTSLVMSNS